MIDFAALGENPLFLINGPTGSGKTTILDGICFALYGKTSSDERDAAQMRCDAADPETLSFVELVFSLRGKIWRIRREPEQLRPKGRGAGLTLHQPRAELVSRDASGKETVLVASKVTEAKTAIEELTGLNVDQFRQVMVLPQGEFRNLLMAKSADREKVFSHLFQTQIYTRIEFSLKEQASLVRKDIEARRNKEKRNLQSAELENEDQLKKELESQVAQLEISASHESVAAENQKQSQQALQNAQKLSQDFERLEQARRRLQQLQLQSREVEVQGARLKHARAASGIQPGFDQWQAAIFIRQQAEKSTQQARESLGVSQAKFTQAGDDLQQLTARESEIESKIRRQRELEAYRSRVGQYETAIASLELTDRDLAESVSLLDDCRSQAEGKQQALEVLQQQQRQVLERLKGLADQQLALHRLENLCQHRQAWEEARQKLQHCEQKIVELTGARNEASTLHDEHDQAVARLELAWHSGQAAVLAEKLNTGQPCPVCGSWEHPQPANTAQANTKVGVPSEQARQAAALRLEEVNQVLLNLDKEIAVQEVRQAHLAELSEAEKIALGVDFEQPLSALRSARNAQQQQLVSLQDEQAKEKQIADRVQGLASEFVVTQDSLQNRVRAHSEAVTQNEVAKSEMRRAEAELPVEYRKSAELESRISDLQFRISEFHEQKITATQWVNDCNQALSRAEAACSNAEQQLKSAQQAENKVKKSWHSLVSNSPFADEVGFSEARLEDVQIATLETQIKQHHSEFNQASGAVKILEAGMSNQTVPNLEMLERVAKTATTKFEAAQAAHRVIDKRVSRLQDIAVKLAEAKIEAGALEDTYAVVGTLAETANGKTGNRISLQRFVLSVLLDDVLTQASQRFKRMSKGRYVLYRQQEKGKGSAASGLELLVDDAYSGKQRPVATLSGGESFMAALSLALGLSDVVQAYAGGIKLDALFIDEGFGSLDPESLDLAVNTLIDLQSSGRMVGIISHVPELKERINVRLAVIADHRGSHTRIVA